MTWHAYELRPKGSPPIPPEYRAQIESRRPQMEAIARTYYGLEIHSGPFGINSRPAMVGAKYAAKQGKGEEYNRAMLRAYWHEACDISDLAAMQAIATQIGLNRDEFTAALARPDFEAEVDADIMQAYEYGLTGVPALVFENKYLVMGAQPYEELRRIVEQIEARQQAHS